MSKEGLCRELARVCGLFARAILLATMILQLAPDASAADKPEKAYKRALELRKEGKLEEARLELQESLRLKPDFGNAKILLGLTCYQIGQQLKREGNNASALAMFQEAVGTDPEEAYWHAALSQVMQVTGDKENAAKECAEAARLSPLDALLAEGCLSSPESIRDGAGVFSKTRTPGVVPGPNAIPPIPYHKPQPPYTERARLPKLQGESVLIVIVDERGNVEQSGVLKPLGLGLDQQALQTVSGWRFEPGKRNGIPVRVKVLVEVQFRLF